MMYGLLGEHLGHSYSPFIHNLLGSAPYQLVSLKPDELGPFLSQGSFQGLNVTIPYKKAVIPYLDHIAPEAEKIGAVNTIVRRTDGLWGYNTDYHGFLYAAHQAGISFSGKKVVVLGSGGASASVQAAAQDAKASDVIVVSRTGTVNYDNVYDIPGVEIVVNATPVGMYPDAEGKPVELSRFSSVCGVIDLIYNPLMTQLLMDARALGINYTGGLSMLVAQAKYASDLFQGSHRLDSIIPPIINKTVQDVCNIVLVGMPGCGKSTVGMALSKKLGRKLIDCDALVESQAGMSIPDIFRTQGEKVFRDLETNVIEQVGKERRLIIATGGGAVLRPGNVRALRQNGKIVFLMRNIEELPTHGRPLSKQGTLDAMYKERLPLYQDAADIIVDAGKSPDHTADSVIKELDWK